MKQFNDDDYDSDKTALQYKSLFTHKNKLH